MALFLSLTADHFAKHHLPLGSNIHKVDNMQYLNMKLLSIHHN
jgi:hypothetical protein